MKTSRIFAVILALFCVLGIGSIIEAADGDIDTTYGSNGMTVLPAYSNAVDIAIQGNDKAVVLFSYGNDYGVVRFNTDGSLDTNFGTNGLAVINFQGRSTLETQDTPHTILIQPNGKILVAGSTQTLPLGRSDFALARLNRNGNLDNTFGTNGIVRTDFSTGGDIIYDLAIQDNGKIVAVGQAVVSGNVKFGVARYMTDGSLDTTFATAGTKTIGFGQADNTAYGVAVQDDGKIVVTGRAKRGIDIYGSPRYVFALARLRNTGALDPTFSTNGKVTTPWILDDGTFLNSWAGRVAIQADGKIVVSGFYAFSSFGVARYETDGSEDTTFGSGGRVLPATYTPGDVVNRRIVLDGGRIIFGGWTYAYQNFCNPSIELLRYDSNGTADPTFGGGDGDAFYNPFFAFNCPLGISAESFALQSDGKIVTAGDSNDGSVSGLAIARFYN